MKKILTVLCLLLYVQLIAKDDPKYPVSAIPEQLMAHVNAVIREDHMSFKILDRNKATGHVHYVVTILNEKGNDYASHYVFYDKLTKIMDVKAIAYNAQGEVIKKLKSKEITDHALYDGFSLFSDDRIKSMDLSQPTYPYTVEFEYEQQYDFLYYIPGSQWGSASASYQHASYSLSYPPALAPRYKLYNIETALKKTTEQGFETLTWTFENVMPLKFETSGPPKEEIIPHIIAAPSAFDFEGYSGNMSTWQGYGLWQLEVNQGRDQLSDAAKEKVKKLVKDVPTTEQKAKAIYEYLQSKTRYVGIQLGIGGWQPFPASVVDEMGYGDCKALSNYMVSMLKEAGVKAYYTIIYAGKNNKEIQVDFPSNQGNHIIVCVPNAKDTIWLECTSQTNPFGYQGTFTEDRWAILVTENGGKLVRTINYKPEQNLQTRTAEVTIEANGNARAKIKTTYTGIKYETDGLNRTFSDKDKQKKWIEENTDIPNFNINSYSMTEKKDKIPSAAVNIDLTLNRYASVSGKRLFITPNLMNRITNIPEKAIERKTDVVRKNNFIDYDTVIISIPENIYPEFLPEPVKITSKFGEYETDFKFDAGKVIYTRRLKMWKGRFPKETYNELVDFYKNISKADNTKLVFLSKT